MPWSDPIDHVAESPRLPAALPDPGEWDGQLHPTRGVAVLDTVAITGASIEADGIGDLQILDSQLSNCALTTGRYDAVDIIDSVLIECDLSRVSLGRVKGSRLVGCKLVGTDVSESTIRDTELARSTLTYTNAREASLTRVAFIDCQLEDVDLSAASLHHCTTAGCELSEVNIAGTFFEAVDLRDATLLGFTGIERLAGCVLSEKQVLQLAPQLALAAGATIERRP